MSSLPGGTTVCPRAQNLKCRTFRTVPTAGWGRGGECTLHRRLRHLDRIRPLIALAKGGMSIDDWRDCLRLWIGATEQPFHDFAIGGCSSNTKRAAIRSGPKTCARSSTRSPGRAVRRRSRSPTTASSAPRATFSGWRPSSACCPARVPVKTFASIAMSDDVMMFYAHMIADLEGQRRRRCRQASFGGWPTCPLRTCMWRSCGSTSSSG